MMKKCPYCAEEIQDAAIVCRYCRVDLRDGKHLDKRSLDATKLPPSKMREVMVCPKCSKIFTDTTFRTCTKHLMTNLILQKIPLQSNLEAPELNPKQNSANKPGNGMLALVIVIGISLLITGAFMNMSSDEPDDKTKSTHLSDSKASAADVVGTWVYLRENYVMADSKELFEKAIGVILSKDTQAWSMLILSGHVKSTEDVKEKVYVENISPWSGEAQVRLRGGIKTWWTSAEAVLGRY